MAEDEQTGSNRFLPILPTAKPSTKKDNYVIVPKIFGWFIFCLTIVTMAALLKDTRRQPLVFHRGSMISTKKSWGAQHAKVFSPKKNLTKVATLAASDGFILMFDL